MKAGIKSKVKAEATRLEGEYETKLKENTESHKAEMVEKVDSYLNYVVEEWMKENQISIERGIKGEIALKTLLVDLKNYLKATTLMFLMKSTMYLKIKLVKLKNLKRNLTDQSKRMLN